jgi:hypothetical protein
MAFARGFCGPSQIEFTKQNRLLSLAQFWQQTCPFMFALQQQLCSAKKVEAFIDSKYV